MVISFAGVVYAVFLLVAFIAAISAFNSLNAWDKSASATGGYDRMAKSPSQPRTFSFASASCFSEQSKTFTGAPDLAKREF